MARAMSMHAGRHVVARGVTPRCSTAVSVLLHLAPAPRYEFQLLQQRALWTGRGNGAMLGRPPPPLAWRGGAGPQGLRALSGAAPAPKDDEAEEPKALREPKAVGVALRVAAAKDGAALAVANARAGAAQAVVDVRANPRLLIEWTKLGWGALRHFASHMWTGAKLMAVETRLASKILMRLLRGNELSRRERVIGKRVATDLFRLVPFSFFVLIPFMEVMLPVALKMFPNMLPSQFEDKLQKEDVMKKKVKVKLEMARFLQTVVMEKADTLHGHENPAGEGEGKGLEAEGKGGSKRTETFSQFMAKVRNGEEISSDEIVRFSRLFKDEFMLDNLPRTQLISMGRFLNMSGPWGPDRWLRFSLRQKLKAIKQDDREIFWEGVARLNDDELKEACDLRGIPVGSRPRWLLEKSLGDWLKLSSNKDIPASLLIMSRAFGLNRPGDAPEKAVEAAISAIPEEVFAGLEVDDAETTAADEKKLTADEKEEKREKKLESLKKQEALLEEELAAKEEKQEKKKKEKEELEEKKLKKKEASEEKQKSEAAAAPTVADDDIFDVPMSYNEWPAEPEVAVDSDQEEIERKEEAVYTAQERDIKLKNTVELIETLSNESAVGKEREEVRLLQEKMHPVDEHSGEVAAEPEPSSNQMVSRIDAMLAKLDKEMQVVDETIGTKHKVMDQDDDGVMSTQELLLAMRVMRNQIDPVTLERALRKLDSDGDGKFTKDDIKRTQLEIAEEAEPDDMDELEVNLDDSPPLDDSMDASKAATGQLK